jgi:hypothetical protein
MGKITDLGSAPPDDPMFSGGPSLFSPHKFRPSSTTSQTGTDGATQASPQGPDQPLPPMEDLDSYFKDQMSIREALEASLGVPSTTAKPPEQA